jgi:hypothetical protein
MLMMAARRTSFSLSVAFSSLQCRLPKPSGSFCCVMALSGYVFRSAAFSAREIAVGLARTAVLDKYRDIVLGRARRVRVNDSAAVLMVVGVENSGQVISA